MAEHQIAKKIMELKEILNGLDIVLKVYEKRLEYLESESKKMKMQLGESGDENDK